MSTTLLADGTSVEVGNLHRREFQYSLQDGERITSLFTYSKQCQMDSPRNNVCTVVLYGTIVRVDRSQAAKVLRDFRKEAAYGNGELSKRISGSSGLHNPFCDTYCTKKVGKGAQATD